MIHGHSSRGGDKAGRKSPHGKILGTTTVGERGQIVIPVEARTEMNFSSGDKVVVFGNRYNESLTLIKADVFDRYAEIIMSKSKKLEKLAEEILSATQGNNEDNEEEPGESFENTSAGIEAENSGDANG